MLVFLYGLNAVLMIILPLILAFSLTRRFGLGWGLAGVGALTFIGSQVVHLPLLWGLDYLADRFLTIPDEWGLAFNAIVLGLMAGLCEEIARYIVYARFLQTARTGPQAIVFGAGHGGIEAIIFGGLAGLGLMNMLVMRDMDLSTLPGLSPDQLAALQKQVADYWAMPWYGALLGALERVWAVTFHISAALLVLQAFTRRHWLWLAAAILWHTALNAAAAWSVSMWGAYWAEAILGLMTLISIGIIWALRRTGLGAAAGGETAQDGAALPTR